MIFRRVGALALALGACGVVACSNDDSDGPDCQDCGGSTGCPDPTCLSAEVDFEIYDVLPAGRVLPRDGALDPNAPNVLPAFPLEIVVSFEGDSETYQFVGTQPTFELAPRGPCTDANGEAVPELCRVEGDHLVFHIKARSTRPEIYGNTKRVVGVAIKDGEGRSLFSYANDLVLDGRLAPGCHSTVDPAQCGYEHLELVAPTPTPVPP